jgi:hypothetical protein
MNIRRHTKLVREGQYAAEVDVEVIEANDGWPPHLSGDIQTASHHARVYRLTPVSR